MCLNVNKMNRKVISQLLKVLGNNIRMDILQYLRGGEKCVCNIFDHLHLSQNLVSHHLAILRKSDFIKARKDGKWVYYSLNPVQFTELNNFIEAFSSVRNVRTKSKC